MRQGLTAPLFLTPKLFGLALTACRTLKHCTAAPMTAGRRPVRLTCLCSMVTTFGRNRLPSARPCYAKSYACTRNGIQYVEHTEGDGAGMFKAACKLGLEGIVSKKVDAPYRSGPSRTWIKVKNPRTPAASRATDGTF